jgi:pimeloyl-ACP methyl ester carboxylesterase
MTNAVASIGDVDELTLRLGDGRTLHGYDRQIPGAAGPVVVWHHGTPNIGLPPEPLFALSDRLGIRWVSYDRPGYGGSDPAPGRTIGSAASHVAALADHLGIERFAVMGHSGGSSHALASAALLPERVSAVLSVSAVAPFDADGLDWFAGMAEPTAASLRAAAAGRVAKEHHEATATETDPGFITADHDALRGDWSWLLKVVEPALASGPGGLIDDDLAYVGPWGFDVAGISAPTLFMHGGADTVIPVTHSRWLAERCTSAELRVTPNDGHISVLRHAGNALAWLAARVQ